MMKKEEHYCPVVLIGNFLGLLIAIEIQSLY